MLACRGEPLSHGDPDDVSPGAAADPSVHVSPLHLATDAAVHEPMKRWPVALTVGALTGGLLLYHRSDGYRNGNRPFYRDGRPTRAGRAFGRAWSVVAGLGLTPSYIVSLETTGRRTGRVGSIPMVLADLGGERYVVSMLGERSPWVHNVRAADGRAFLRHGRRREVHLVELPPEARAPILKAYLHRAVGARPHMPVDPSAPVSEFARVAARYPVFRVEPVLADP